MIRYIKTKLLFFNEIYNQYKILKNKLNNSLSLPPDFFDPRLKYYLKGNTDAFHSYPFSMITKFKMHVFEELLFNFFYKNYPKGKIVKWLIRKRTWGDLLIISSGGGLRGYKRFRFFGNTLIYVEDCFLDNKGVTLEYLQEQSQEVVRRDWDFRVENRYNTRVITPVYKAFYIHAFAPEIPFDLNSILNWEIYLDIRFYDENPPK